MSKLLSKKRIQREALEYTSRSEFFKKNRKMYDMANSLLILDEVCSHMGRSKTKPLSIEEVKERASIFAKRMDFRVKDQTAYKKAIFFKVLDEVCSHMDKSQTALRPIVELQGIASRYTTRGTFHDNNKAAYEVARTRGILDQICSHMPKHIDMTGENCAGFWWPIEVLQLEALKYFSRSQFYKNNVNMYMAAQRRGALDLICGHMGKSGGVSFPERELKEIIKQIYPLAKQVRDMTVKIEGKPHIKGFDIDIFIPGLNMGIEFDGTYHHSFKGLKRSRSHWPDEDIQNYHQLKDNWFLSKGIKILHIKEQDWIKNKEECIEKCFNFINLG